MDDIRLEDEPFEPFDDYEDYADQMMQEAERQDQLRMMPSTSSNSNSNQNQDLSANDELPEQLDFLGMLQSQAQAGEQEVQRFQQQRLQERQQEQQWQGRKSGGGSRPIGSAVEGGGVVGDLGDVKVTKKRVKQVTLDQERLLGEHGLPLLLTNGKRFKIRHKYKDSAEKNANAKNNLADLMRVYQTWAHNLFPKATFKDFITQAESKCKEKQIRATMEGWRDAQWNEVRGKRQAKEEAERAEQEALDRQNGVWEEHEKELGMRPTESMDRDALLFPDMGPSISIPTASSSSTAVSSSKPPSQPQPRPVAVSRKGKEKAFDNASTTMRLHISDDEDDDYAGALDRMRISMNLDHRNGDDRILDKWDGVRSKVEDREEQQEGSWKNEIDLDNYNSDVEDDEEEDEPLFTHRALKMIGELKAAARAPEESSHAGQTDGDQDMDQEATQELPLLKSTLPEDVDRSKSRGTGLLEDTGDSLRNRSSFEEDEDELLSRRKPAKGRRTILMDDSDDE
ncbi:replication fork protection component Swi3-domain-containing protein [Gamsiella multidivaricata]|uniref:replication fork protection component Swi3-domain-containing protein n=1 Tax=Gamsiella multidivaricata TaxID=101098 RepID=UPI00221E8A35|nr:replication fork protection component Swi3-domain-containing protein [Gamsiella multidivaricata]KAI7825637.1 replication fork protection component Swi3-domain-containing protein [Gamsiella multidivaricata]